MAVLKMIGPIHVCNGSRGAYAHLDNAIRYALKPEKTADGLYTGSENCLCERNIMGKSRNRGKTG